jgi:N-acetylmuramoyl-L-alanine amidase
MKAQRRPGGSWVAWRAGRIEDPVVRLRYLRTAAPDPTVAPRTRFRTAGVVALMMMATASAFLVRARVQVTPLPQRERRVKAPVLWQEGMPDVWQVEKTADSEVYSNGLRIDSRYVISTHARSYRAFPIANPEAADENKRTEPVGIVFHTTESQQAPFEAGQNRVLKQVGESILEFVRRHRAYNFLIDRFGRVYRVVAERDAAEHAGYSVWADDRWVYINLNESFIGVSFEAKTQPGQEEPAVSPAQIRAAAMLTEMLRSRYAIAARNCVTHAQVSVNPDNMRVGWHTDWASAFPFEKLGLPNNYALALPALAQFGFEYDDNFVRLAGTRLFAGVELAEEQLQQRAAERGLSMDAWRKTLQRQYREKLGHVARAVPRELEQGDEAVPIEQQVLLPDPERPLPRASGASASGG